MRWLMLCLLIAGCQTAPPVFNGPTESETIPLPVYRAVDPDLVEPISVEVPQQGSCEDLSNTAIDLAAAVRECNDDRTAIRESEINN